MATGFRRRSGHHLVGREQSSTNRRCNQAAYAMTKKITQYGVLSHYPRPHRTEHVHIGIVCFLPEGITRVHFGADLKKLRAMDPANDTDAVRSWENGLRQLVAGISEVQAANFIRNFGQWSISDVMGSFVYISED